MGPDSVGQDLRQSPYKHINFGSTGTVRALTEIMGAAELPSTRPRIMLDPTSCPKMRHTHIACRVRAGLRSPSQYLLGAQSCALTIQKCDKAGVIANLKVGYPLVLERCLLQVILLCPARWKSSACLRLCDVCRYRVVMGFVTSGGLFQREIADSCDSMAVAVLLVEFPVTLLSNRLLCDKPTIHTATGDALSRARDL